MILTGHDKSDDRMIDIRLKMFQSGAAKLRAVSLVCDWLMTTVVAFHAIRYIDSQIPGIAPVRAK